MHQYRSVLLDPMITLLQLHKLAYFSQESGKGSTLMPPHHLFLFAEYQHHNKPPPHSASTHNSHPFSH